MHKQFQKALQMERKNYYQTAWHNGGKIHEDITSPLCPLQEMWLQYQHDTLGSVCSKWATGPHNLDGTDVDMEVAYKMNAIVLITISVATLKLALQW